MTPITVIADDLSGAAETAEQFRLRGHETSVSLGVPSGRRDTPGQACGHGTKGRVLTRERNHWKPRMSSC